MHEVRIALAPLRGCEPFRPPLQVGVRIVFQAQPDIAPGRGLDKGRRRVVLPLGKAERGAGGL